MGTQALCALRGSRHLKRLSNISFLLMGCHASRRKFIEQSPQLMSGGLVKKGSQSFLGLVGVIVKSREKERYSDATQKLAGFLVFIDPAQTAGRRISRPVLQGFLDLLNNILIITKAPGVMAKLKE